MKQALVIGNNSYVLSPLESCVNDAVDMSTSLRSIGFQVQLERDADLSSMEAASNRFVRSIKPGSIVVLYYSGHGAQYDGYNFLFPTDGKIVENITRSNYQSNLKNIALSAERLIEDMHSRNPRVVIVILDSCRSYFGPQSLLRSRTDSARLRMKAGLAPMRVPPSTIVAYACAAETESSQFARNRRNSLYTYHLLRYIKTPNTDIDYVLRHVAIDVQKDPLNLLKQIPYRYSSCNEYISLANASDMYPSPTFGMRRTGQVIANFKQVNGPILSKYHFPSPINSYQNQLNFQYYNPNGYQSYQMNFPTGTRRYPHKRQYSSHKPLFDWRRQQWTF